MPATIYSTPDIIARNALLPERHVRDTFGVYQREHSVDMKFVYGELMDRPTFKPGGLKLADFLGPSAGQARGAAGELLTTPPHLDAYVQKTVIDLNVGRESVPILYTPCYRRITDANFTETVNIGGLTTQANVVFSDHIEGEEVVFGAREWAVGQTVQLYTYTAGFEWTEDMVEWDQTWQATQASEGFGRGYNALLNHLHLWPIISYNYPAKNITDGTTFGYPPGTDQRIMWHDTLRQALQDAASDTQTDTGLPRTPTVMLAPTVARFGLEEAMASFTINNTPYSAISQIATIIYYDGYSIRVGNKTYSYRGVPPNPNITVFLIQPAQYLVELVKHDLRVDAFPGDMSRLIAQQVIARTRRGVFAAPEECVQKVILP